MESFVFEVVVGNLPSREKMVIGLDKELDKRVREIIRVIFDTFSNQRAFILSLFEQKLPSSPYDFENWN